MSGVSFSAPANYAAGDVPTTVTVGDFNGDGRPDLAVASGPLNGGDVPIVSVLLGNSDGTFQTAKIFSFGWGYSASGALAVGDFNGDGKLDLVTVHPDRGNVGVWLGNGDGTFQTAQHFATGGGSAVVVGDFNGDGKLDLAVANEFSNALPGGVGNLSMLLGNGEGTFQPARIFATGGDSVSLTKGDFNGDGKLDLAVANQYSNSSNASAGNLSVLLGNGDGTFQTPQIVATGVDASSVVVADFNGDGKLDLALTFSSSFAGGEDYVSMLRGNGDGSFQAAQNIAPLVGPRSLVVADFNGDGKPDLALLDGRYGNGQGSVLVGNGDGTFQTGRDIITTPAGLEPASLAVGDFNGDGRQDLAVTNPLGNSRGFTPSVSVLLSQFATMTAVSGPSSSTYGQSVAYTATVTSGTTALSIGTVTFLDGSTLLSPAVPLDAHGMATFGIATLNAGSHTITASYTSGLPSGAGTTGFGPSTGIAGLTVNPVLLSAKAVNFSAIAGAPYTGAVATFSNADPFGSAASYTAIITWGDGSTSTGTITGTGTLMVSGMHTYADSSIVSVSVQISHNLGNTTTAAVYPTANVTPLGQDVQHGLTGGIGFWHNKNGQALINGFNGGSNSTALSSWLATVFPNLYGANGNDLTGDSNGYIAYLYQTQFALPGSKLQSELLATALNVYATTQSLGGTIGRAYGFTVSANGLGADSFNVGADGAAFGVANNTTLNVYEMLVAVDRQVVWGVLYNGDTTLGKEANDLFDALNKAGSISP